MLPHKYKYFIMTNVSVFNKIEVVVMHYKDIIICFSIFNSCSSFGAVQRAWTKKLVIKRNQ